MPVYDENELEKLYFNQLQGDFYGKNYYRKRNQEEESAIVYSDDADKRIFSYIIKDFFNVKRILEIGCAMGFLLKQLLGFGFDAWGIDFSTYCVENVPKEIKNRVKYADLLDLPFSHSSFDMVVGLDILEHLPETLLPKALKAIKYVLKPGGVYLGVIPAYGENKFGPLVFDVNQRASWVEDASKGRPFREIPLDVNGKPHMGHLIHATVDWWENQFDFAGMERLGFVEQGIHRIYDTYLDPGRWGIFVFKKKIKSFLNRFKAKKNIVNIFFLKNIPYRPIGFFNWEFWQDKGWIRWTGCVSTEILHKKKSYIIFNYLVNHKDCTPDNPVYIQFSLNDGSITSRDISSPGWYRIKLKWPKKTKIAILSINLSRTFVPDKFDNSGDRRQLGIALGKII